MVLTLYKRRALFFYLLRGIVFIWALNCTENFQKILEFVAKIVDAFDISEEGTHVGVIHYSDKAVLDFDFNKFKGQELNRESIVKEINRISVTEGQTRIDLALALARERLFSLEGGMRPDKPKVCVGSSLK